MRDPAENSHDGCFQPGRASTQAPPESGARDAGLTVEKLQQAKRLLSKPYHADNYVQYARREDFDRFCYALDINDRPTKVADKAAFGLTEPATFRGVPVKQNPMLPRGFLTLSINGTFKMVDVRTPAEKAEDLKRFENAIDQMARHPVRSTPRPPGGPTGPR